MEGFCSLSSGSRGNSLYFGTQKTKILIDAGLSGRATEKKLAEIGVSIDEIEAILITHEHSDHIQGLKTLALKKQIPVLANAPTARAISHILHDCPQFKIFTTGESFQFGGINIHPFSIQHDSVEPVGFTLSFDHLKLAICTDLGFATSLVRHQLKNCDHLFVESNHEPYMVHACPRPPVYKQRVLSRNGHLSNEECAALVKEVMHPNLKSIQLAHLSKECNNPAKALEHVSKVIQEHSIKLSVASQEAIGEVISF